MSITEHVKQVRPSRRGRQPKRPTTQLGNFIQEHLNIIGMTRAELANRLHVSPSTVGRLLNGDTRVVQRVSLENICEALELDERHRRDFLCIAKGASTATFALATGLILPKAPVYKIDLDLADDFAEALQMLLNKGEAKYVMESSQHWYNKLLQVYPDTKDTRIAATQIRFGMLLGSAQTYSLPWYRRGNTIIQTYNHIEENIICRFDLNTFRHEHAKLLGHRAPIYRELTLFEESARQFEDGLYYVKGIDDTMLHTSLLRNHAHIRAILGDELRWAREIGDAQKNAQRLDSANSEDYFRMAANMQAEGYRRLAFTLRKDISTQMREKFAKRALEGFAQTRDVAEQLGFRYRQVARRLIVHVSEAQCLVWIDPEEAIRRAEQLRDLAVQYHPTVLDKINRVIFIAQQRLQKHRNDPPMLFDLDARPGERLIWY